ncbi:MAG TPA: hypothetical protein DEA45_02360 [Acholeplasmataceae bacterium]|nr:hypothetical protein [Acholeplasmataceae bacterium]
MKKIILSIALVLGSLTLSACTTKKEEPIVETEKESVCKNQPLSSGCFDENFDLDFISTTKEEFLISETFENEFVNQQPYNWLLYRNQEYHADSVSARVVEVGENKVVQVYSDGKFSPPFPQGVAKPESLILSTKFNLDQTRSGVATGKIMVPSTEGNEVSFGVYTGAVNVASILIDRQMKLTVKIGGPFFYHSGNGDSGNYIDTGITLSRDEFQQFSFYWDGNLNELKVIFHQEVDHVLYEGNFHISSRINAEASGTIMVPNVFKVTMPKALNMTGFAYIDDIIVTRKGA